MSRILRFKLTFVISFILLTGMIIGIIYLTDSTLRKAVLDQYKNRQKLLVQQIAGRIETLIRMFNNREGLTRTDDTLPHRTLFEPLPDGPAKGQCIGQENLDRMIDEYYEIRGWDSSGVPTQETLKMYQL